MSASARPCQRLAAEGVQQPPRPGPVALLPLVAAGERLVKFAGCLAEAT